MRWPWQRSAPSAPAREPMDAAARPSPAGWAFLPPLVGPPPPPPTQLRGDFLQRIPTRVVPIQLTSLGHVVSADAPAATLGDRHPPDVERTPPESTELVLGTATGSRRASAPAVQRAPAVEYAPDATAEGDATPDVTPTLAERRGTDATSLDVATTLAESPSVDAASLDVAPTLAESRSMDAALPDLSQAPAESPSRNATASGEAPTLGASTPALAPGADRSSPSPFRMPVQRVPEGASEISRPNSASPNAESPPRPAGPVAPIRRPTPPAVPAPVPGERHVQRASSPVPDASSAVQRDADPVELGPDSSGGAAVARVAGPTESSPAPPQIETTVPAAPETAPDRPAHRPPLGLGAPLRRSIDTAPDVRPLQRTTTSSAAPPPAPGAASTIAPADGRAPLPVVSGAGDATSAAEPPVGASEPPAPPQAPSASSEVRDPGEPSVAGAAIEPSSAGSSIEPTGAAAPIEVVAPLLGADTVAAPLMTSIEPAGSVAQTAPSGSVAQPAPVVARTTSLQPSRSGGTTTSRTDAPLPPGTDGTSPLRPDGTTVSQPGGTPPSRSGGATAAPLLGSPPAPAAAAQPLLRSGDAPGALPLIQRRTEVPSTDEQLPQRTDPAAAIIPAPPTVLPLATTTPRPQDPEETPSTSDAPDHTARDAAGQAPATPAPALPVRPLLLQRRVEPAIEPTPHRTISRPAAAGAPGAPPVRATVLPPEPPPQSGTALQRALLGRNGSADHGSASTTQNTLAAAPTSTTQSTLAAPHTSIAQSTLAAPHTSIAQSTLAAPHLSAAGASEPPNPPTAQRTPQTPTPSYAAAPRLGGAASIAAPSAGIPPTAIATEQGWPPALDAALWTPPVSSAPKLALQRSDASIAPFRPTAADRGRIDHVLAANAARIAEDALDVQRAIEPAAPASTPPAPVAQSAVAAAVGQPEQLEHLLDRLYPQLVRRLKSEMLLDRERRGVRIDRI
ncbi:hypothetical protein ACH3VR_04980 [Microbacterium sp. B2969]|uniref:Uncharacterized protein n=1 Tax=Microbacterium alkaliflavum TaxID=3248839 RepID=A0ABW7Q5F4_9MICO